MAHLDHAAPGDVVTYPDWHVVTVTCTTCDSGATVAVSPAWVDRARCGPCIQNGVLFRGELRNVPSRPSPGRPVAVMLPERAEKVGRADLSLPAPEWRSDQPWPVDFPVPGPVVTLRRFAAGHGWVPAVQYARGWKWGVGTNMSLVHSVALKLRHAGSGLSAVVVYEAKVADKLSWTVDMVWVMGSALPAYGGLGVTSLKRFLEKAPGWTPDGVRAWVDMERDAARVKVEAAKARAKAAPKKAKESAG